MRRMLRTLFLLGVAIPTANLDAQSARANSSEVDVAVTYNAMRGTLITGSSFWQQGGGVDLSATFYHGFGAVANIAGARVSNINGTGVNLTMVTELFGPRYTWVTKSGRVAIFGQELIGEANGLDSVFTSPQGALSSSNSFALLSDGGMDIRLSKHLAVRPLEAGWLRTQLPNAGSNVQNSLTLGGGVVFRLP
jgi:outer membrane immunogenic protein